MRQNIPKQFLTVNDCPLIIYTMEAFQNHPEIDIIAVVCLEGWEGVLDACAKQFKITKLKHIIKGGKNGHESAQNGVYELEKYYNDNDIILIHDGNRPLVSAEIISNCIATAKKYGWATPVIPCQNVLMKSDDAVISAGQYPRDKVKIGQTPHGVSLKKVCALYRRAAEMGIDNSLGTGVLMTELGEPIHLIHGSEKNFKITTVEDMEIFKALLSTEPPKWLK